MGMKLAGRLQVISESSPRPLHQAASMAQLPSIKTKSEDYRSSYPAPPPPSMPSKVRSLPALQRPRQGRAKGNENTDVWRSGLEGRGMADTRPAIPMHQEHQWRQIRSSLNNLLPLKVTSLTNAAEKKGTMTSGASADYEVLPCLLLQRTGPSSWGNHRVVENFREEVRGIGMKNSSQFEVYPEAPRKAKDGSARQKKKYPSKAGRARNAYFL